MTEQLQPLPEFIIIGAMKSATTTLYEQLKAQPGIFMPELKEPNYFSDDEQYARGQDWYKSLFSQANATDLIGEASTHYTKQPIYPHSVSRMKELLPSVRLVYVMRHPVDRLVSHYIHEWTQGVISADINQALEQNKELIDYSRYAYQLLPFIEAYGRDSILPVFFEGLKARPQEILEQVCAFIGYAGKPQLCSELAPSNVSSERIRKFPLYSLLVDSAPASFLRRNFVPRSLREKVKKQFQMKDRPELSESSLRFLDDIFDEDLALLGDWMGVSINCRNFSALVRESNLSWSH